MGTDGSRGSGNHEDNFSRFLRVSGTGREHSWLLRYLRRATAVPRPRPGAPRQPRPAKEAAAAVLPPERPS